MRIVAVTMVTIAALVGCSSGESSIFDAGALTDGGTRAGDSGSTSDGGRSVANLFEHDHPWTKDVSMLAVSGESTEIISTLAAMDGGGWGGRFHRFQFDDSIHVLTAEPAWLRVTVVAAPGYYADDCEKLPATVPLPGVGATKEKTRTPARRAVIATC